jgi:hypothetical protein
MWKRAAIYGVLLAAGTLGLQWLDYLRLARMHSGDACASRGLRALGRAAEVTSAPKKKPRTPTSPGPFS